VLLGVTLGMTSLVLYAQRKDISPKVLSESIVSNSVPLPTLTLTPTPTPSPAPPPPTQTPTPNLAPLPMKAYTSEEIHGFIEDYAKQYGVSIDVLRHIAVCESGFNPQARNGPYIGLYQFGPTAWKNNRALMGEDTDLALRFDAKESAQTAAYLVSLGRRDIWPNCYP